MRMRAGTRHRAVALAHGWPEFATGWTRARGKRLQSCGSYDSDGDSDGRKKRANGVNPDSCASIYNQGPLDPAFAATTAISR
jgi:hypothetical protein